MDTPGSLQLSEDATTLVGPWNTVECSSINKGINRGITKSSLEKLNEVKGAKKYLELHSFGPICKTQDESFSRGTTSES